MHSHCRDRCHGFDDRLLHRGGSAYQKQMVNYAKYASTASVNVFWSQMMLHYSVLYIRGQNLSLGRPLDILNIFTDIQLPMQTGVFLWFEKNNIYLCNIL